MKSLFKITVVFLLLVLFSCVSENHLNQSLVEEDLSISENDEEVNNILSALNVSDSFRFAMSKNLNLVLDVPDFLNGATFSIYGKVGKEDSLSIASGTFDANGHFEKRLTVTSRLDSLLIFTNYIGLIDNVRLPVTNKEITFDYTQFYDRTGRSKTKFERPKRTYLSQKGQAQYTFIDTFDGQGVPDNLAFADVIEQNLLDDINASLPENVPGGIPSSNPDFLAGKETSLIITEEADVLGNFCIRRCWLPQCIGVLYISFRR